MAAGGGGESTEVPISLALPKGHMKGNVFQLLEDAGMKVSLGDSRGYRPTLSNAPGYDAKLLKPQNILGFLATGSRDLGFAGADWVSELGVEEEVVEVLDTGLDPVRLVVASPDEEMLTRGVGLGGRKLIIASEYPNITQRWIEAKGVSATFFRAYGATESLPPEDADAILDNTATGSTLRANHLSILDTVMHSTTRLFASKKAMADPAKKRRIDHFVLLLRSVLEARSRRMLTFNCPKDLLPAMLPHVPCMRAPSVSELVDTTGADKEGIKSVTGYAIQVAVAAKTLPTLIPTLKDLGATDIIVTDIHQIM